MNYDVSFPMFAKIDVNGDGRPPAVPVAEGRSVPGSSAARIKWNFTKFLVGRDGQVLDRFAPTTTPDKIEPDVEKALRA